MLELKGESTPNPSVSTGTLVEAIIDTWKVLARHGETCGQCADVIAELRKVPDDWLSFYDQCCAAGQELFGTWADARQGMVEQFKDPTTRRGGGWTRVGDVLGNVMFSLQQRRRRLGMIGLSEKEAEIRARALEAMPTEAFQKLLAVSDDEAREAQIRALVDAQRHRHIMAEVRPMARSIYDDRVLFRWWCSCGVEASGDYFSAEDARNAWGRHVGLLTPVSDLVERTCRLATCDESFKVPRNSKDRYCCFEHAQQGWGH